MLDVKTIAAGGGSILQWKNKMFVVGPEVSSRCGVEMPSTNRFLRALVLIRDPRATGKEVP